MTREVIFTEKAPKAVGPYVQGIKTGGMIYCSGQLGIDAAVNRIYESYFDGRFPARSCVQVAKLPLGGLVEVECIAVEEIVTK